MASQSISYASVVREIVERAGSLSLAHSGATWEILWDGMFLMSSECRASERALGALAAGRTLVGGLGMGFTLRAALDVPGVSAVDVVEIAAAVVAWNRGHLAELAGRPLEDARVRVQVADVAEVVAAAPRCYDAVLLDVDNGPSWTARPENAGLYDEAGIAQLRGALRPGGRLAIWSAQPEPELATRLAPQFATAESRLYPVVVGGRPCDDIILVAYR